jgi:hypothetical protein
MLFNLEKPALPPHCGSQKQLAVPGNYSSGIMECWNDGLRTATNVIRYRMF